MNVQEAHAADIEYPSPVYCNSKSVSVSVPEMLEKKYVCISPEARELEYYKILRTQVQQNTRLNGCRTIMITSVCPGAGATLTAINLAITMARDFHEKILLVDANLKKQQIHYALGYESEQGIADHLVADVPLGDLIVWPGIGKLTVLSGGRPVEASAELLGSPKMLGMIQEMKKRYDDRYILFDAPPLLDRADSINLAPMVDCILITVDSGRTGMRDVRKALSMVPREKVLGFVMNRHGKSH